MIDIIYVIYFYCTHITDIKKELQYTEVTIGGLNPRGDLLQTTFIDYRRH